MPSTFAASCILNANRGSSCWGVLLFTVAMLGEVSAAEQHKSRFPIVHVDILAKHQMRNRLADVLASAQHACARSALRRAKQTFYPLDQIRIVGIAALSPDKLADFLESPGGLLQPLEGSFSLHHGLGFRGQHVLVEHRPHRSGFDVQGGLECDQ